MSRSLNVEPITPRVTHGCVEIIDQRFLPYEYRCVTLRTVPQTAAAIADMQVRGAPLIGICAAYGIALGMLENQSTDQVHRVCDTLKQTRPTAVNLMWAVERMRTVLLNVQESARIETAWQEAIRIDEENRVQNEKIGQFGLTLIAKQFERTGRTVNILTHCNAGRLATPGWGTALAPIYLAHQAAIPVHVFIDETRPRNQGLLTAWELNAAGISHTVIVDNAGGLLMQQRRIDMAIVGADRVTKTGDVCNKIGTYLKALAAKDNHVPFYAAFPLSTVDWTLDDGITQIPIENRSLSEIQHITGIDETKTLQTLTLWEKHHPAENPGFDVTPARLVTGLITERGICLPEQLIHWKP